jgi:hypothetical protein
MISVLKGILDIQIDGHSTPVSLVHIVQVDRKCLYDSALKHGSSYLSCVLKPSGIMIWQSFGG